MSSDVKCNFLGSHLLDLLVVFGSHLCYFIADGTVLSFGNLFDSISDHFDSSSSTTAVLYTFLYGLPLLLSPIACALSQILGVRKTGFIGAIFCSFGYGICFFSTSIFQLWFCVGVLVSIGLAMIYISAYLVIAFHFKKRALVTGIAVSGSGAGTFCLSLLFKYLLEQYTFRGTILLIAGLQLQLLVAVSFFKITTYPTTSKMMKSLRKKNLSLQKQSNKHPLGNQGKPEHCDDVFVNSNEQLDIRTLVPTQSFHITINHDNAIDGYEEIDNKNYYQSVKENICFPRLHRRLESRSLHPDKEICYSQILPVSTVEQIPLTPDGARLSSTSDPFFRFKSCPDLYIIKSDVCHRNHHIYGCCHSRRCPANYRRHRRRHRHAGRRSMNSRFNRFTHELKLVLTKSFNREIFCHGRLLMFCLSCFLCMAVVSAPHIYLPPYITHKKVDKNLSAWAISVIGISNMIGQVVTGFFGDLINPLLLYSLCILLSGVSTLFVPFYLQHSYELLLIYCGLYGAATSVNYVLLSTCLVHLVGLEYLPGSFGLVQLTQGFAIVSSSYIGGVIFDALGSYEPYFVLTGSVLTFAGLISLLIPCADMFENIYNKIRSVNNDSNASTISQKPTESFAAILADRCPNDDHHSDVLHKDDNINHKKINASTKGIIVDNNQSTDLMINGVNLRCHQQDTSNINHEKTAITNYNNIDADNDDVLLLHQNKDNEEVNIIITDGSPSSPTVHHLVDGMLPVEMNKEILPGCEHEDNDDIVDMMEKLTDDPQQKIEDHDSGLPAIGISISDNIARSNMNIQ